MTESPATGTGQRLNVVFVVSAVLILGVALITTRAVIEGEAALRDTDAAIRRKDLPAAIQPAYRAASWYVPGAPHVSAAYRRLEHIARVSEAQNDAATALDAWRMVRAAALETRSVVQTRGAEISAADIAIARLSAPKNAGDEPGTKVPSTTTLAGEPRSLWLFLLAASLMITPASLLEAARRVRHATTRQTLTLPLAIATVGIACYAVAVWQS